MAGLSLDRRSLVWLLDLDIGGRVYRFATEPVEVTDAAGKVWAYAGGLTPLQLGSTRLLGRLSMSLTVASVIDWALTKARGISLEQRTATLRLWDGQVLEESTKYLEGLTERVKVGEIGEPLTFDVVEDPSTRAVDLPDSQAVATDDTWPVRANYELPDVANGGVYPIVIGYPGDHPKPGATDIAEPAVPAIWVERQSVSPFSTNERWVWNLGRVHAAQVTAYSFEGDDWQATDLSVVENVDLLGRLCAQVEATGIVPESTEQWVGLRNASGFGGGVLSPYRFDYTNSAPLPLRGAGEVIRYFLDYFSPGTRIDEARIIGQQAWLDRFKVDGVLTEQVGASDWLQSNVLDFLPVLGVEGSEGLYYAPVRWDATKIDRVAHLDADAHQVYRDGDVTAWGEPIYNKFTLDYRPLRGGKSWASRRILSSIQGNVYEEMTGGANLPPFTTMLPWIATSENDERVLGSAVCRASQAEHGIREWKAEHGACWDDATAALILQYKALKYAWPKRQARYIGGVELRSLNPGDVVTLTDSTEHLAEHVCLVLERTTSISSVALDLVLLDHPLQTARAVV